MKQNAIAERLTGDDRGVSPVIGVILMVAITVILAAVIGTFVLDLGQSAGNSAPSASLTVDSDVGSNHLNVSHKGGDSLVAEQTKIVIKNETGGSATITYDGSGGTSTFAVGDEVNLNLSGPDVSGSPWGSKTGSGTVTLASGSQYSVQFIDLNSQRVIFETTITA